MDKSWVHFDRRSPDYVARLNLFVDEALAKSSRKDKITCPCKECCNRYFEDKMTVVGHLLWHGMDPLYMNARWTHHGEPYVESTNVMEMDVAEGDVGEMHDFLNETFVQPNIGCKKYKKLDAVVKLYQIKCLRNVTNKAFDMFLELFKDMLHEGYCLPRSISQAKKIIDDLGLTYEKIDACPNDCMLFWKETANLTMCSTCGASRYKVKKALMHLENDIDVYLKPLMDELKELVIVQLGIIIVRKYQLRFSGPNAPGNDIDVYLKPLMDELKELQPFLFLSLLIPGPNAPGNDIDVYLKPLMDELKELWEVGANTYDVFSNQSFNMKAAVLWTINDFPAYANLSGWSTKGKLACPQCHHQTVSKRLPNCKKQCYLGNRRFLPITHRFRNDGASFDGKCERGQAPKMLTEAQCIAQMSNLTFTFGKSPPSESETDGITRKKKRRRNTFAASKELRNGTNNPWKKKSIFSLEISKNKIGK
ncbi:uncharacterized protein LOC109831288 [Asparagus officinalis]|uniref:uncharacterized protein LOC109831288 n=1 Tax=Asparagus officinalis TaxID=4686 RepID=UPI00098DEE25|nr:uncharacterized protein LOC109831288 [Asparagus officinalis]